MATLLRAWIPLIIQLFASSFEYTYIKEKQLWRFRDVNDRWRFSVHESQYTFLREPMYALKRYSEYFFFFLVKKVLIPTFAHCNYCSVLPMVIAQLCSERYTNCLAIVIHVYSKASRRVWSYFCLVMIRDFQHTILNLEKERKLKLSF